MKKILNHILLLTGIALAGTSCEEKIDIKVKNGTPKVVVEANISDQPGPYYVLVSKSKLFNEDNNIQGVAGATVVISDDAGNSDTLTEPFIAGLYQTNTIQGVVGRNYRIQVTVEGVTYESFSQMQPPVDIDSLYVFYETNFEGEQESEAEIIVRDPAGVSNFYRLVSYKHGKQSNGFNVQRDRLWDGKLRNFNVPDDGDLVTGDTLTVELRSIDERSFIYFDQFNDNQNNFGAPAAPANPDPVFTPSCLGYFSAYSVKTKTIIVQ